MSVLLGQRVGDRVLKLNVLRIIVSSPMYEMQLLNIGGL